MTNEDRLAREKQWLDETDPGMLLAWLPPSTRVSKRKLRLCGVGCCRQIWHRLPEGPCRHAVEVGERYADRRASPKQLTAAHGSVTPGGKVNRWLLAAIREVVDKAFSLRTFIRLLEIWTHQQAFQNLGVDSPWRENWNERLCEVIRDGIGNPYRPVAVNSAWRSANVIAVAQAIYADRRFEDMPILADAMEEAGCTDAAILEHCRERTLHVRGCWLVDLILGKR